MTCKRSKCLRPVPSGSLYCREHGFENKHAHLDWRREAKIDKKLELDHRRPTIAPDDDWRAAAISKAVLPRGVRLFGSETASRWRMRDKEGAQYAYDKPVDGPDDGLYPIEYRTALVELKEAIYQTLQALTPREQIVLRMRFGITGRVNGPHGSVDIESDDEMTLKEIGDELDLTRESIRRIESQAFRTLRSTKTTRATLLEYYGEHCRNFWPTCDVVWHLAAAKIDQISFPNLPPAVIEVIETSPLTYSSTTWFIVWSGCRQPVGASLGKQTIGWTTDDQVASDTGRIIGSYQRILEDDAEHKYSMVIWIPLDTPPSPPTTE